MMDRWNAERPRLLLVYLNSNLASQTARHFRRLGWEVRMTPSAEEAIRLVESLDPKVVVVDADLPEDAGWRVANQIAEDHPDRSVVMIGAEASEAVIGREALDVLADEVLGRRLLHA